ncbi:MAG: hypothetical protein Q7V01_06110, partial [Vicinamibacterales bacterium]|nr:hypothetical protein [Vicinamibacterales bacterium]
MTLRRYLPRLVLAVLITMGPVAGGAVLQPPPSPPIVDAWRYTVQKPAEGWEQAGFEDREWQQATGGFGTHETPGARVGTVWATSNIWLRKVFDLAAVPAKPALLVHHDEDAEVFINGRQIAAFQRWS